MSDRPTTDDAQPGHEVPHGGDAGATSTPYADGEGVVGLQDRFGKGAPDTNQGKVEPMPAAAGGTDPSQSAPGSTSEGLPLDEMSVGSADPQAPSRVEGGARPDHSSTAGSPPAGQGTGQRARTSLGVSPEPVDTDVDQSVAHLDPASYTASSSPGDAHGVPTSSTEPLEGSSETLPIVQGVRTPVE